jgi:predicted transcriptional regulator
VTDEPLTELQLAIMQALWSLGEAGVPEVQGQLEQQGRRLAPTTVATLLRRMEKKGWVAHREQGRAFLYRATGSRHEVSGRLLDRMTGALFGGDVSALVSQLLDSQSVTARDLARIKRLIESKEKKR